jgi:hypothetical protein
MELGSSLTRLHPLGNILSHFGNLTIPTAPYPNGQALFVEGTPSRCIKKHGNLGITLPRAKATD